MTWPLTFRFGVQVNRSLTYLYNDRHSFQQNPTKIRRSYGHKNTCNKRGAASFLSFFLFLVIPLFPLQLPHVIMLIDNYQRQTPCKQIRQAEAALQQQRSCHTAHRHPVCPACYGREMNIQCSSDSCGEHHCSQNANLHATSNSQLLWYYVARKNSAFSRGLLLWPVQALIMLFNQHLDMPHLSGEQKSSHWLGL